MDTLSKRTQRNRMSSLGVLAALMLGVCVATEVRCLAEDLPPWTQRIRKDHPRLFFSPQTWPAVQARALGEERRWYLSIKTQVDRLAEAADGRDRLETMEYGPEAAWAAFVFRVTREPTYLELSKQCLEASLSFYEECFERRKTVNWFSTSRVHATLAWDWLYNDLTEVERRTYMSRLVRVIDDVMKARPPIYREHLSDHNDGFYGVRNCLWFIGCTAYGTGIEPERVTAWLVEGHDENIKLLKYRKKACGDDGGGASPTLRYVINTYPWAEQNFLYTWLSSTGENLASDFAHGAWLGNYVLWNWIAADPVPLEFGYGDTPHTDNRLPLGNIYTHMANIQHLYGKTAPEAAALARHVQQMLPRRSYSNSWFIYPFLLDGPRDATDGAARSTRADRAPASFAAGRLPYARHFENMGQIFMRSGMGKNDTYCLFTCGGTLTQHRHYDALNFVIYHRGFLALDSGTRYREFDNGQHLANYFAQTVAHNCVVIHQLGEPPARYWGGTVVGNHGGQHKQLGSVVKAFETNDNYVYVAGDATACYQHGAVKRAGQPDLPEKCDLVTRQILFLPPDHFVVFDRIVATDPEHKKDWLLHMAHEPLRRNRTIRADHRGGRMFCTTVLPKNAVLDIVGGPGREFWAAGKNWDIVQDGLSDENLALMGAWRVEVSPAQANKKDVFLHVIEVGDTDLAQAGDVELVEGDDTCGVKVQAAEAMWEVVFKAEGPLGGHLRRRGAGPAIDCELTTAVQEQSGIWP